MCGIFSVFLPDGISDRLLREKAFQLSRRQRHRGPDSTGVQAGPNFCIVQERLSIIGLLTGRQPLLSEDGDQVLAANGEIYNYLELAELISTRRGIAYKPRSDSDVIMALYQEFGKECASLLWGMFGFVIYEKSTGQFFAARDGLGVCSLYYGVDQDGRLYIASEMKCIPCEKVSIFPPGCYLTGTASQHKLVEYYHPAWSNWNPVGAPATSFFTAADLNELRTRLETSVNYHLSADVPIGCFLSGGLNSSIIAALAQKIVKANNPDARLKTFAIGMADAPDLAYARRTAEFLGTDHVEVVFTLEEALDVIPELIWHLETYDSFAVRAAVPMYLLSRVVRSAGIKTILSGEGADEIFGGYLYFHSAPSVEEFRQETITRLFQCHLSDGLRANKTSMAQSVELRAPFLGSPFVNYAMSIRPEDRMPKPRDFDLEAKEEQQCTLEHQSTSETLLKDSDSSEDLPPIASKERCIEKWLLRKAFEHLLPAEVAWRQKEQFSDGVGHGWIEGLQRFAADRVDDESMAEAAARYPHNTPTTKEEFMYREIFSMEYPGVARAHTVVLWKPKWVPHSDTSGRASPLHWSNSMNGDDAKTVCSSTNALSSAISDL